MSVKSPLTWPSILQATDLSALNPGATEDWGWDEVNRCIMKAENWTAARPDQVSQMSMNLESNSHGQEGPIQVGFSQWMFETIENWTP